MRATVAAPRQKIVAGGSTAHKAATAALGKAGCALGKVKKPSHVAKHATLVVRSASPAAGAVGARTTPGRADARRRAGQTREEVEDSTSTQRRCCVGLAVSACVSACGRVVNPWTLGSIDVDSPAVFAVPSWRRGCSPHSCSPARARAPRRPRLAPLAGSGELSAAPTASGTTATVPLTCAGASTGTCAITATLDSSSSMAMAAKSRPKARAVVDATAHLSLNGGAKHKLVLRLDTAGKRLLARKRTLTLELVVTQKAGVATAPTAIFSGRLKLHG
jgi:hypothetical protein